MAVQTLKKRLLSKIQMPVGKNSCWIWNGALANFGYGKINTDNNTWDRAHRVSWTIFRGKIPSGKCVLHSCDVPACFNPDHLFLGTRKDNYRDMVSKGRKKMKLNDKQIPVIRNDGRTLREIASEYDISISYVSLIKNHRLWAHIK